MRKKLSSRTFLVPLVLLVFGGLGSPSVAHAGLFDLSLSGIKKWLGDLMLTLSNYVLGVAGNLLDFALERTVVSMAELVNGIAAIETGWIILRDLTNIFFIFVLLYAAISLILGAADFTTKTIVTRVVVVALLVNFSLFFTKAIVDVSNVVALEFYDNITITECLNSAEEDAGGCEQSGISTVFMTSMELTSIYDSSSDTALEPDNALAIGFIGSIFILIATFVFFAGAILFIIRFAVLILLMMISPLALVAAILPSTKSWWKRWLNSLLSQAFFAPMYLGITYIVALIVSDPQFKVMLYGGGSSFADELSGTWVTGTGSVILGFLIVSALLIATLTISKSMSVTGASTVVKWGNSAKNWGVNKVQRAPGLAAQNTLGRAASKLSTSETLKENAAQGGLRGFAARSALSSSRGVAKAGFGVRKGGYEKKLKDQTKKRQEFGESLGYDSERVNHLEDQKKLHKKEVDKRKERIQDVKAQKQSAQSALDSARASNDKGAIERETKNVQSLIEKQREEEKKLKQAEKDLDTSGDAIKSEKQRRTRGYAETLESRRAPEMLFSMVPRKNKEAAQTIRKKLNKDKDSTQELKDYINEKFEGFEKGGKDDNK